MSYCVNCGVELDFTAKKCALCNTPVLNPNVNNETTEEKPFSDNLSIPQAVKKRFIAFAVSVTMLVPNIVMFFLNVFFIRGSLWSMYVFSSSLLFWFIFVFPFFMKKSRPYIMWFVDTLATVLYSYVIFLMHGENMSVLNCVIATLLFVSLSVLLLIFWLRRKKRHWTAVTFFVLLESTVVALLSGIIVAVFLSNFDMFVVGIVISVCTFVLMCFFIYCNRSKHIRAWLNKAFYV